MIGDKPTLVDRRPVHIAADTSRVVTRLFVPGHEGFDQQESRSAAVLRRLLALSDEEVQDSYDDVHARFDDRHHRLSETFLRHADELSDRLDPELQLSRLAACSSARPSPASTPLRVRRCAIRAWCCILIRREPSQALLASS